MSKNPKMTMVLVCAGESGESSGNGVKVVGWSRGRGGRLYCRDKENGVNILKSIDEGPYKMGTVRETLAESTEGAPQFGLERSRVYPDLTSEKKDQYNADIRATNILLQGLPKDIYTLINHYIDAKDIWDNVKMLLEGSELTKEDRESQLYDDLEHFRQYKGELIHDYYVRFAKLINDMRNIKMTMFRLQLNFKFVNNMLPEWGRFVTAVKLNRELRDSNYDQLYAYLKQHETHAKENKMMLKRFSQPTVDPLALLSNVFNPQHYSPSSSASSSTQVPLPLADSSHIARNCTQPKRPHNSEYFKDKMLLMQAQENRVALDAKQLLFLADVDKAPTAQSMFMANLSFADPVTDKAGPSYDSNILSEYVKNNEVSVVHSNVSSIPNDAFMMIYNDMYEPSAQSFSNPSWNSVVKTSLTAELATYKEHVKLPRPHYNELNKVAIGYKNLLCLTRAKQIQPALYNDHEILKDNHAPAKVHNTEDTLEMAKITRKKMNDKMNDPECVTRKVKITPHDYSKDNFLATFTPQKQLTPEQIFWSNNLMKLKSEALKERTKGIQKALTKEIKEMKDVFEELEAEVAQYAVDRKHDAIKQKSLLIANDNLIAACLSQEVFSVATNSELNVARFTEMHVANTTVEARCLALEAELANLRNNNHDNQKELIYVSIHSENGNPARANIKQALGSGFFNSLVHSSRALSDLRCFSLRTASTAAKPCQGDSLEFYLITGSIYTDQQGTVYQAKPTEKHLKEVKRIFRYLRGTVNTGLWYTKDSGFELTRFLDADYAGCKDTFKSTSGGAQFLREKLLTDYGFHFKKIPIYSDSKSAIAISCNPVQHSRTKHIVVRYHFIKEHVEKGTIELYFVKADYQLADIFTKALPADRFNYLVRRLVNQQTIVVTIAMTAILKQFQATPPSASVKAVEEIFVTYGGAHLYYQCLAASGNTFPEPRDNIQGYVSAAAVNYNQGNSDYRPLEQSYQAPTQQNQIVPLNELEKVKRMNEANMKAMQTQINIVKNELRNVMKNSIQASLSNQTNEVKNMMASLFQMNIASTSGSGSLPSNIVPNPKGKLKAITTQSGLVLDGPTVPTPTLFINPEMDERVEETLTDPNLSNELKCKDLADLGASINLMPLSVWKKLGLPELISTRMTLELANRAICTPAGIARDVFILIGKFTFLADFVIVNYESDPRVPLILGRPFLRTARALIDVHESINLINVFDDSSEDFLEDLFSTNQPSGNPTFSSHPELTSLEVQNDIFDLGGGNVLPEKLLDLDSTKDLHPPLHSDLKEIEFPLHQDIDSSLKDSIDKSNLVDNFVDSMPEMFTDEHALDYSSPQIFNEYDDDFLEVESNTENVYDDPFNSKG
nr:copia protein [Tanacetum cinerariifolium]